MTPREFFNAWIGYAAQKRHEMEALRDFHYGAARFNASSTAFSGDQSKAVANYRFPWEKTEVAKNSISVDDKIGSFIRRQERKHGRKAD